MSNEDIRTLSVGDEVAYFKTVFRVKKIESGSVFLLTDFLPREQRVIRESRPMLDCYSIARKAVRL